MRVRTPFTKINSIVENKVWGCLADTTFDADRYEKYLGNKHKRFSLMEFWSNRELKLFMNKLKEVFNQDVVIMKKDKMDDVIRQIKKVVGNNLSRM